MLRPQTLLAIALLVGLALYTTTDRRNGRLAQENTRLQVSLAASVEAEALAASASKLKEKENAQLRILLQQTGEKSIQLKRDSDEVKRRLRSAETLFAQRPPVRQDSSPGPAPIRTLKKKGEIPHVLQEEQLHVGVEVGVFRGGFSNWVLSNWPACTRYSPKPLVPTQPRNPNRNPDPVSYRER